MCIKHWWPTAPERLAPYPTPFKIGPPMFRSFFLAGFEGATGYNMHGEWIDQIAATHHDLHVDEDYRCLEEIGIRGLREAIRWPLVDERGRFDFDSVRPFVTA